MKKRPSWLSRHWQAWLQKLDQRMAKHAQSAETAPSLPPFSRDTWWLYADVILQSLKSLTYYLIAALGIGLVFGIGLFAGYFASIVDATPIPTQTALTNTLTNVNSSTSLYYANNVALGHVKSDLIRDKVSLKNVSPYLKKAIVATEDEDFYQNDGVVPKAVIRAVVSELTGIGSQTGGSTLTQQVVKLQFLSSETTFKRKVTEIMYALRLNHFFTKDAILEAYLNIVTLGRNNKGQNIAGVQTAAEGLFGKSAKDLNLAEAAFIAGLPQSPSVYTPYTINGTLSANISLGLNRQKTVLFRMYRAGMITKKQYTEAKAFDLKKDFLPQETASEESSGNYVYNMVTSEAETVLGEQLAKDDGHTQAALNKDTALANKYLTQAKELLSTKGYQVHSTINKQVYDTMQTVAKQNADTLGTTYTTTSIDSKTGQTVSVKEPVQNGSVLLDNNTGAIIGFIGGLSGELNHIYTTRSPGSSIKPLLVYGPAIENKLIGSQTMLADFATDFPNYSVTDYGNQILNKFVPATTALKWSYNIPTVNLYNKLRETVNVKSYMEKMGIDTLTAHDYSQLGLALGGADYGLTVQAEAAAYATFSRGGTYVEPYVIDKIVDPLGNVIYQHKAKPTTVFSPATSYIMRQMMHQVIASGTAEQLNYQVSFDTTNLIGKTGTSNDYKDIWFTGSTPGVTLSSWIGYDNDNGTAHTLSSSASNLNMSYWAKIANAVYRLIPNTFNTAKTLSKPSTVKSVAVNSQTGEKAGTATFAGSKYKVSGNTLTSLYNNWEPTTTTGTFGIGGSTENYALFWAYLSGNTSNGYGTTTTGAGSKPKSSSASTTNATGSTGTTGSTNSANSSSTTTGSTSATSSSASSATSSSASAGN